jgi:hypothetical protein
MARHEVDPRRDVRLITAGNAGGQVTFSGNSHILSLASMGSKALFSNRFAEGLALHNNTSEHL